MKTSCARLPKIAALAALPLLVLTGCGHQNTSPDAQNSASVAAGGVADPAAGASANSLVPMTTTINGKTVRLKFMPGGLKYYDTLVGMGASPKVGQTVSMRYTGTLLDGTKFDSSYDRGSAPFDFKLGIGQVIPGWDEGVATMKVGGKRRLVIPSTLAYGANPPSSAIPPNATLVFDVELVSVK
jgi:peptidylprolyl isomerase